VQRQQSILIKSGYPAQIFAYQKQDSTTESLPNVEEQPEVSTLGHYPIQTVDPSSTRSTAGPSSSTVRNDVTQVDGYGSSSRTDELPAELGTSPVLSQHSSVGMPKQRSAGFVVKWLLLCFYHNEYVSRATHLSVKEDTSDIKLVKELRREYIAAKGRFRFYLSWLRKVTNIKFVRVCIFSPKMRNIGLRKLVFSLNS
jgi:hypothetical protein